MYCKECGNQIADDSKFCASCGKAQSGENSNSVRERGSIENLSLWEYYVKCFKNYATFEGRARRKEFWGFLLFDMSIKFVFIIIALFMAGETFVDTLSIFLLVATLLPSLAVYIRRLHDIGKSGWWLLFAIFIPIIGQIMGLVWFCTDSEYNENEYGQNPKHVNSSHGEPARTKGKGSRISILAIVGAILLLFIGMQFAMAIFFTQMLNPVVASPEDEEAKKEEEFLKVQKEVGVTLATPIEVTININGEDGHFLKCGVQLEYSPSYLKLGEELEARKVRIKNIIIDVFSSRSLADLMTNEGKKSVRDQIVHDVNDILPENDDKGKPLGKISRSYFDSFMIQ